MNVLITGGNGQLGSELKHLATDYQFISFFFTDVHNLDITIYKNLDDFVSLNKIDIIVNCAAYTAVDRAEDEPAMAELINSKAVYNLSKVAGKYEAKIIHISTDYVFDGSKNVPYHEDDTPSPNSAYGLSKYKGEQILQNADIPWIIIRTSWLYSGFGNNFVKTMIRLGNERDEIKVVFDQTGTPTYARNLASAILKIISDTQSSELAFKKGIYHFSDLGVCSWYDFAIEIFKLKKITCKVIPVLSKDFPVKANRPSYSVLNKEKIMNTFNLEIPHWTESLKYCLHLL